MKRWPSEAALREAVAAVAARESARWPIAWRAALVPPQAGDAARNVVERGRELLQAVERFTAALEREGSPQSTHLARQLGDVADLVELRSSFAAIGYWGRTPKPGRLPERSRSQVAARMIVLGATLPTARDLALASLVLGTPIPGWRTSSVAEAIRTEARAMRIYLPRPPRSLEAPTTREDGQDRGASILPLPRPHAIRERVA